MDGSSEWLQRIYYTAGIVAVLCTGVSYLIARNRKRFAAVHARIDALEARAVTQATFKATIAEMLERGAEARRGQNDVTRALVDGLNRNVVALRAEVSEIRSIIMRASAGGRHPGGGDQDG